MEETAPKQTKRTKKETADKAEKEVKFNGNKWTKTVYNEEASREYPFFADADMQDENVIEIEY